MKNSLFGFIVVIVFNLLNSSSGHTQYVLTPSKTINKYQAFNNLSYDSIHIRNVSTDTLYLNWELLQYDSADGSYIEFCSSGNCWLGVPQSGSFPPIPPSGFGWAGVHFWTGNTSTIAIAKIWLYKRDSIQIGDTLSYYLHGDDGSGVDELYTDKDFFTVYPNPSIGKIHVSFQAEDCDGTISVLNSLGEIVFNQFYQCTDIDIPSSKMNKGIYFVVFENGKRNYCKKIVLIE